MSKLQDILCSYCNKEFKQKQGLIRHLGNSCKIKQEKENNDKHKVEIEELKVNYDKKEKENNDKHKVEIEELKSYYDKQIFELKNKYEKTIIEISNECDKKINNIVHEYELNITKLNTELESNKMFIIEFKKQHELQNNTNKELTIKAIENSGTKNINTVNHNRNQIYQNMQPLTDEHMRDQTQYLTVNNVKNGAHGIAHFASNHTFKDRLFCSDKSRLNFVFKNESESIIKDPEGVEITKKFIDINRDELMRLLDEYFDVILNELDKDLDIIEFKHWAAKREEIIAIRSAVKNGNTQHNKEYYSEFKKSFLSALSDLVPR